jgi:hypothetical protein
MGWAIGYDENWKRDIGYGVPCLCDHPDCNEEIDRGVSYVCGAEPFGGDKGCGLYFCDKHQFLEYQRCECCNNSRKRKAGKTFEPKPDTPQWMSWKLHEASWKQWRNDNPEEVKKIREALKAISNVKPNTNNI